MGPAISSASGQPTECWGWQKVAVNVGGRIFRWRFLLAAVAFPLLGADFLQRFALTVDLHSFCVRPAAGKPIKMEEPPMGCAFALLGMRPALTADQPVAQPTVVAARPEVQPAPATAQPVAAAAATAGVSLQHRLSGCSTTTALQHRLSIGSTTAALTQQDGKRVVPLAPPAAAAGKYAELLKEFPAVLCQ
jgi:hypothetical protein